MKYWFVCSLNLSLRLLCYSFARGTHTKICSNSIQFNSCLLCHSAMGQHVRLKQVQTQHRKHCVWFPITKPACTHVYPWINHTVFRHFGKNWTCEFQSAEIFGEVFFSQLADRRMMARSPRFNFPPKFTKTFALLYFIISFKKCKHPGVTCMICIKKYFFWRKSAVNKYKKKRKW